ncbi:MAG: glucose 1-dehydrogenase [Ardenticatenaceae bacterium]|nr:glucose 1-dehydrogenase [Ardenticatenaceae bacterium]
MRLQDRVALVTGGSGGIGSAICLGLADEGADVIVHYGRNEAVAHHVAGKIEGKGRRALAVSADLTRPADVERLVATVTDRFGRIDILVNAAGVIVYKEFFDLTAEDIDRMLAANIKGVFLPSQAVASVMRAQGGGKIVTVASYSSVLIPNLKAIGYAASKGGVLQLVRGMAKALGPYNIYSNCVMPGTIVTELNRDFLAEPGVADSILDVTPLGRLGYPPDVVGAVIYLASQESNWTTGAALLIDGGRGAEGR